MSPNEVRENIVNKLVDQFSQIMLGSVRLGKCRCILLAIKKLSINYSRPVRVLIMYPNIDIKNSWVKECDIIDYHPDITYSTYISVDKVLNENWDFIVMDEAHTIPVENILPKVAQLIKRHSNTLLASGTYSSETMNILKEYTGLSHIINYTTEEAIKDGIVANFSIVVHKYKLDDSIKLEFGKVKKWRSTELKECNRLSYKVDTSFGKEKMFHALNRMRFINSCASLVGCVNYWISQNQNERFLLFSGDENVAKRFNLPMFNSKSKDDALLQDFQKGVINKLCLIRKGAVGISYPNLRTILITAINSNGENLEQICGRALLTDTEDAVIHIFVSNQEFQLKWLKSALENINPDKIKYIDV